jgi:hypothetical protein
MMLRFVSLACVLLCAALPALAQYDRSQQYGRPYERPQLDRPQECWNPRAGHFERVRPGEYQNDLDFAHCRVAGYARDNWPRDVPHECWNPRARHFERVRPDERQDDLDFSSCRPLEERAYGRPNDVPRECWNPRAGHFEAVRPGEVQNDLDFTRCRRG